MLTFRDDRTRTRRDHVKYLTLIRAIALLHQHQRPVQRLRHQGEVVSYIEVQPEDIALANRLAHGIMGRSLDDLPPVTRRLLGLLDEMVTEECERRGMARQDYRFTRRTVREHTKLSYDQVRIHMRRLVELELVLPHRGGRGQLFVYELVYDGGGDDGAPLMMGLLDPEALNGTTLEGCDEGFGGQLERNATPLRPTSEGGGTGEDDSDSGEVAGSLGSLPKNASGEAETIGTSYPDGEGS